MDNGPFKAGFGSIFGQVYNQLLVADTEEKEALDFIAEKLAPYIDNGLKNKLEIARYFGAPMLKS
jgi:hypothetical protein